MEHQLLHDRKIRALEKVAAGQYDNSYKNVLHHTPNGISTGWTRFPTGNGGAEVDSVVESKWKVPVQGFLRNWANEFFPGAFKPKEERTRIHTVSGFSPEGKKYRIGRGLGSATYVDGTMTRNTFLDGKVPMFVSQQGYNFTSPTK